jgi:hypothetical protein
VDGSPRLRRWALAPELSLNQVPEIALHMGTTDTGQDLALGAVGVTVGAGLTGALIHPRAPRAAPRPRRAAR